MTLAIDGGTPACNTPWPSWPPPPDDAQRALLHEVVDSGNWGTTSGHHGEEFAAAFAKRHGTEHGVLCTNGTIALFVALRAAGIGPGDEVIIPSYTFVACATSVFLAGATPVLADVDPRHLHLTAETVESAITPRTRAIMVVHLAGSPADMDALMQLAKRHDLLVIEDSAQAHGARYHERPVGALGDISTFSFQSSKAMTAGEGGILCTNDKELADRCWTLCNVGRVRDGAWYGHPFVGWNLRMTELQAALLLPWLDRLDEEIARREQFTQALVAALADVGAPVGLRPDPVGTTVNSRHLLLLELGDDDERFDREWLVEALAAEGLPVDLGYPGLHGMEAIVNEGARVVPTPGIDAAAPRTLWLRQSTLMAAPERAAEVASAFHRVLGDPRARTRT